MSVLTAQMATDVNARTTTTGNTVNLVSDLVTVDRYRTLATRVSHVPHTTLYMPGPGGGVLILEVSTARILFWGSQQTRDVEPMLVYYWPASQTMCQH